MLAILIPCYACGGGGGAGTGTSRGVVSVDNSGIHEITFLVLLLSLMMVAQMQYR